MGTALAFMMAVTALSLPEMIILRKVLKPKLLAVFVGIMAVTIIFIGYFFNMVLSILFYLYQNEEKCVCSLTDYFKISQSALSYHLKILSDNGLLIKRQEAVWNLYSFNKEHFMVPILEKIFKNKLETPSELEK